MRLISLFVFLLSLKIVVVAQNNDFRIIQKFHRNNKTYNLGDIKPNNYDSIVILTLHKQNLKRIPKSVYKLSNLEYLDISENDIRRITCRIKKLERLKTFFVSKNKIKNDLIYKITEVDRHFIKENPDDLFSGYLLTLTMYRISKGETKTLYENLSDKVKISRFGIEVKSFIDGQFVDK